MGSEMCIRDRWCGKCCFATSNEIVLRPCSGPRAWCVYLLCSFFVFCNKSNEILLFWPCRPAFPVVWKVLFCNKSNEIVCRPCSGPRAWCVYLLCCFFVFCNNSNEILLFWPCRPAFPAVWKVLFCNKSNEIFVFSVLRPSRLVCVFVALFPCVCLLYTSDAADE